MSATASRQLSIELLKLLLQVAWADDRVGEEERGHIWSMARAAGLSPEDEAALQACLDGNMPLPAPTSATCARTARPRCRRPRT